MKREGKNNTRENNMILKCLVEFYVHWRKEVFLQSQYEALSHFPEAKKKKKNRGIQGTMEKGRMPIRLLKTIE
jgi:hypothetical protein